MATESGARRLEVITRQLVSRHSDGTASMQPQASAIATVDQRISGPAKGSQSSYEQVHGRVSTAPVQWRAVVSVAGEVLRDVLYFKAVGEAFAKISINRPEKRNAFRSETILEMSLCFADARNDPSIGAVILTGEGTQAFCSGGDQGARGKGDYEGEHNMPALRLEDLQVQIRRLPKPVVAMVAGYAIGGGHVLHMICDLTVAADNAMFGQTGPKVGSFDAGYGSTQMVRLIGQKKAREMWFLTRFYNAQQALDMGLVNTVVPLADLELETVKWCREMVRNSPTALRVLKAAMNAAEDGHAGVQELGGNACLLFYQTAEGEEGRRAFEEKRAPDFSKFKRLP